MPVNKRKQRDRLLERVRVLTARAAALQAEIAATCTHPAEDCHDYQWNHGYGKMVTGEKCACGLRRSFKGMGIWSESGYNKYDDPSSCWYG